MRYFALFLLTLLTVSCIDNNTNPKDILISDEFSDELIEKDTFSLNGTWTLVEYFDSININKKISKNRLVRPSWFALLIKINNDSIYNYGSINDGEDKLKSRNDTLYHFKKTNSGEWLLMLDNEILKLININSRQGIDSTIYHYKKQDRLSYLTENLRKFDKTSDNLRLYFNKILFTGKYKNINTKEKIIFKENGNIEGWNEFSKYKVDNYYGTYHPLKNMDNINLLRDPNQKDKDFFSESYKWEFKNDTLILSKFWFEIFVINGVKHREYEVWELTDKKIKLLKLQD